MTTIDNQTYHAAGVIAEGVPTRVHQPAIRVTDGSLVHAVKRIPGLPHVAQDHIYRFVEVLGGGGSSCLLIGFLVGSFLGRADGVLSL